MTVIEEYISAQREEIRPRLTAVYETIREAIPDAEERISWGMPTFWKGRNLIHFAPAKRHIGIYPGAEAMAFFADRLTEYETSKGTLRLPDDRELPLALVAEIARRCREINGK